MALNIIIILGVYGLIISSGEFLSKYFNPFYIRKISHIFCGLLSCSLPLYLDFTSSIYMSVILIFLVIITKVLNIFKGVELSEKKNWGTLYFPLGILITSILFWNTNTLYFTFGILVLTFSDPLAALIGKRYGVHKFKVFSNKSLEGSFTFFISTLLIYFIFIGIFMGSDLLSFRIILIGIIGSYLVTFAEAGSFKGTDNILIPITSAAILSLVF